MRKEQSEKILLAHGGGGQLTDALVRNHILPRFKNSTLAELADSAKLNLDSNRICFTTDSYVVRPLFFNGGDIGTLAVCGTVNDLAVAGTKPVALSLSLIIEAGLEMDLLDKILDSISLAAEGNKISIVTGDTKTVEAGAADKIFINTAGIGILLPGAKVGFERIEAGDKILLSGTIADHGMTIISQRENLNSHSDLKSDCAGLGGLIGELLEKPEGIKFMRDPTRGGLAAALNEVSNQTNLSIEIQEESIPVNPAVQAAADMLGFDVLNIANEGKFIAVLEPQSAEHYLQICRKHPLGKNAAIIGRMQKAGPVATVEMKTRIGGQRIVQMPYGQDLPRIC